MSATEHETSASEEAPEGYEAPTHALDTYPLDGVLIRTDHRTIKETLELIDNGTLRLDPEYQRDFVWDKDKQCRLIESVIMRIPLPVFYVAEDEDGRLWVVDGLQRLTTFQRFGMGDLELNLPNSELKGKKIDQLSPKLRRRFEGGQLVFYSIDHRVPNRVRLDIFDRVNSGMPLTRQQMRNGLFSGPATKLLSELACLDEFREATGYAFEKRKSYKLSQLDREAVNRFLAFKVLGPEAYTGDMDDFLGQALQEVNKRSDAERAAIRESFVRSMQRNGRVFGRHAFCKHESPTDRKRPFNVLLFEVFSVLFAAYPEGRVSGREEELRQAFYGLMKDSRFMRAISSGTSGVENVKARFGIASAAVQGVLLDP